MRSTIILAAATTLCSAAASAQTMGFVEVNAKDNIYGAGQASAPGGGRVPSGVVTFNSSDLCIHVTRVRGSLSCGSSEGCITLNNRSNLNDPDGVGGQQSPTSNTGTSLISGIKAPGEGYLVGVFIPPGGPSGPVPPRLNFTTGRMTTFQRLAPKLDQTFFVGDGLTADGSGMQQRFAIPAGAGSLVFGISDTCQAGNGIPGCYFDNIGHFTVHYQVKQTACKYAPPPANRQAR